MMRVIHFINRNEKFGCGWSNRRIILIQTVDVLFMLNIIAPQADFLHESQLFYLVFIGNCEISE